MNGSGRMQRMIHTVAPGVLALGCLLPVQALAQIETAEQTVDFSGDLGLQTRWSPETPAFPGRRDSFLALDLTCSF